MNWESDSDKKLKEINESFKLLDNFEPLLSFVEPGDIGTATKIAVANMYRDIEYRKYLTDEYNRQVRRLAFCTTAVDIAFQKGRIITLKEQLAKARTFFTEYEKLKRITPNKKGTTSH